MSQLDYQKILTSNPTKHLRIAYENLKQNFDEIHAKEYVSIYEGQSIEFLLENSRYIFSEPIYGLPYYESQIFALENVPVCASYYEDEADKISEMLEAAKDQMDEEEYAAYEAVRDRLLEYDKQSKNLRTMISYVSEQVEELDPKTTDSPMAYLTFAPFMMEGSDDSVAIADRISDIQALCYTENKTNDEWKTLFDATVAANMLTQDPVYMEALRHTTPTFRRCVSILATESLEDRIIHAQQVRGTDEFFQEYVTPQASVDAIFSLQNRSELYAEAFEEEREEVDSLCGYGYHLLNSVLMEEYANTMDPDQDASFFYKESPDTVAHALEYITKKADLYEEARGNDNEELGEPSPTARASAGYMREDPPKKPNPSTAQKVQFKFMDKEAKSYKAKQQRKEKMEEIKGAASAALEVPKGIKNSIDNSVKEWDSWDDERRRKYIIKPGFRKKAFRNLKLAMLYGATTSYSVLMLPITMMVRHYSKQKDRRIRNQLRKELDTELEICKAKIEDAETNGDKKEKYKLMRIKSKLEQERTRVLTNSKYI